MLHSVGFLAFLRDGHAGYVVRQFLCFSAMVIINPCGCKCAVLGAADNWAHGCVEVWWGWNQMWRWLRPHSCWTHWCYVPPTRGEWEIAIHIRSWAQRCTFQIVYLLNGCKLLSTFCGLWTLQKLTNRSKEVCTRRYQPNATYYVFYHQVGYVRRRLESAHGRWPCRQTRRYSLQTRHHYHACTRKGWRDT